MNEPEMKLNIYLHSEIKIEKKIGVLFLKLWTTVIYLANKYYLGILEPSMMAHAFWGMSYLRNRSKLDAEKVLEKRYWNC